MKTIIISQKGNSAIIEITFGSPDHDSLEEFVQFRVYVDSLEKNPMLSEVQGEALTRAIHLISEQIQAIKNHVN